MNETSTDEQDLAKALDSVAAATSNLSNSSIGLSDPAIVQNNNPAAPAVLPPIVPADSPVAPVDLSNQTTPVHEFPKITPIHDSSDIYYKPHLNKVPAPVVPTTPKNEGTPATLPENKTVEQSEPVSTPQNIEVKTENTQQENTPDTSTNETPAKTDEQEKSEDANKSDDSLTVNSESPLKEIKDSALSELRPLVDKLSVSPEEKFETLLLIIRSTDDSSLIEQAHEAAKLIDDESKRAEALLEIIKEIDYLSHQDKAE